MDLKDLLIKEFTSMVDSLKDDYLHRMKKRFELEFKKNDDSYFEVQDENKIPLKRGINKTSGKLKKLRKINEDMEKKENMIEKSLENKTYLGGKDEVKIKNSDKNYRLCEDTDRNHEDILRKSENKVSNFSQGPERYREIEDTLAKDRQIYQKKEGPIRKPEKNPDFYTLTKDTQNKKPEILKNEIYTQNDKIPKYYEKKDQSPLEKRFQDHKPEINLQNTEYQNTQEKKPETIPSEKSIIKTPQSSISKKIFPRIENTEISIKKALDELKFCSIDRTSEILNIFLTLLDEPKSRIIDHFIKLNGEKVLKDLTNRESVIELKEKYMLLASNLERKIKEIHDDKKHESWFVLFKSLKEAEYRRNDSELLILFEKISEGVLRKTSGADMFYVEKSLRIIGSIAKDWKKNDIKNYASVVLKKCNEIISKQENIVKTHINDRLKSFIPI
ncbi:hypothetical protein SteCoe_3871 [Stentor coeruleus]|uniref:Uncharacterized protein n=1 Tax=Stentor coeruleus TaxID=5963 RepID=A0A1R2CW12_9CILI|nr:hypothetical protein SteCoe_3871 [Stentor coeruleus]